MEGKAYRNSSKISSASTVFEDELFMLAHNTACSIPGYLILRLKGPETSLAQLPPEAAKRLGEILARAARAIEQAVGAERVYVLSFCEVDRQLHFHLFPRTDWLLQEYFKANNCANAPVNGPMLFEWARNTFGPGCPIPKGTPDSETACESIREILK